MDNLPFYDYIQKVKNLEHFDKDTIQEIKKFTPEQMFYMVSTMNEVIISLKEIIFIEPKEILYQG